MRKTSVAFFSSTREPFVISRRSMVKGDVNHFSLNVVMKDKMKDKTFGFRGFVITLNVGK